MKLKFLQALTCQARKSASLTLLLGVSLFAASQSQAATLIYNSGKLIGAKGVVVDEKVYDVSFLDNISCAELFNGCDQSSDFDFRTEGEANAASSVLIGQVTGSSGVPNLLGYGKSSSYLFTPFQVNGNGASVSRLISNLDASYVQTGVLSDKNWVPDDGQYFFVDWAPVHAPAPLPILGAVAAIGWSRKLRRRIRESQALAA